MSNPRDLLKGTEEYEVERIVGEKRSKGKNYYKSDGKVMMWRAILGNPPAI